MEKHCEPQANLIAACDQQQEPPQHAHRTAATATPEWRHSRDQHMNHLMACRACYAPTGRYCQTGDELRATYVSTPMEPTL